MALIICVECGKKISDKSEQCIGCGAPITPEESDNKFEKIACPECGGQNQLNALTCISCGIPIRTEKSYEDFDKNLCIDEGLRPRRRRPNTLFQYLAEVNEIIQSDDGVVVEIRDKNGGLHHVGSHMEVIYENSVGGKIKVSSLQVGDIVSFTPSYKDGKLDNLHKIDFTDSTRIALKFPKTSGVLIESFKGFEHLIKKAEFKKSIEKKEISLEGSNNKMKSSNKAVLALVLLIVVYGLGFWRIHKEVKLTIINLLAENNIVMKIDVISLPYIAPISSDYIVPVTVTQGAEMNVINFRVNGYVWDRQSVTVSGLELLKLRIISGKGIFGK